jgi:hypothetical protein
MNRVQGGGGGVYVSGSQEDKTLSMILGIEFHFRHGIFYSKTKSIPHYDRQSGIG